MPRGDRTGPRGMGPMTGRKAGYCAGYDRPGYANPGFGMGLCRFGGRGVGWGRGRGWGGGGRGYRNWYYATGVPGWARAGYAPAWGVPPPAWQAPDVPPLNYPQPPQETQFLKQQAAWLQEQLQSIQERIAELEQAADEGKARQDG